ncbi:MAG: DUF1801 domain-containing protein [Bacteroidota bacterium]
MKRFTSPEEFIGHFPQWENELEKLRSILLTTELKEEMKWGMPAYTINQKNIVGLGAFKSYVGIWFHQGVFLKDQKKKLINAQEGKTKALRQWRFESEKDIDEKLILEYVEEAIQNQKDGKEMKPEKKALALPKELIDYFNENKNVKTAFEKFTPGRKKEFAEYIAEAKREATKLKRIDKIAPMILAGKGLNDRYR